MQFRIKPEVQNTGLFSPMKCVVLREHEKTILSGEAVGQCAGLYSGDVMIQVGDGGNPTELMGMLVPSRFIEYAFDFPIHNEEGVVRNFAVFAAPADRYLHVTDLVASADRFDQAFELAQAHWAAMVGQPIGGQTWMYQIIQHSQLRVMCEAYVYPDDVQNHRSWKWEPPEKYIDHSHLLSRGNE
jgi:hypothetical protein